jgi:hypothetical protein
MALNAVRIGPDPGQADGLFRNRVAVDRRLVTALTGGREGHITGGAVAPAVGSLAVTVAPHDSLVISDGGAGERGTYFATDSETLTVPAIAPETQSRIDALVQMVRDSQYGAPPAGKGVGPVFEFVKGVAGTTPTAPTDSDIAAQFGGTTGGGWFRVANVRIDPTNTEVAAANITPTAPTAANRGHVRRTTDQAFGNATLVDVTNMGVDVTPGTYVVEAEIVTNADSAAGIKFVWTLPASTAYTFTAIGPHNSLTTGSAADGEWVARRGTAAVTDVIPLGSHAGAIMFGRLRLEVVVATAGRVQLQAAQQRDDAGSSRVLSGSSMEWRRVA